MVYPLYQRPVSGSPVILSVICGRKFRFIKIIVVVNNGFNFKISLNRQIGPDAEIIGIRSEEMLAEIVKCPLGMTYLTIDFSFLFLVGGMLHDGDGVVLAVASLENKKILLNNNLGR